jgi:hypothetical protein
VIPIQPDGTQAPALHRLGRTRGLHRVALTALWAWCAISLLWLLPLGGWSAGALPIRRALLVGVSLTACGGLLCLLHHAAARAYRPASADGRLGRVQPAGTKRPRSGWPSGVAALILAAAAFLAAPLAGVQPIAGLSVAALSLLTPLGGLVLAARWGMRGAIAGAVAGVALFAFISAGQITTPIARWQRSPCCSSQPCRWQALCCTRATPRRLDAADRRAAAGGRRGH